MFIMIDGIDGSGKSTVVSAWKKHLSDQGNAIFDLKDFLKEKNCYPEISEFKSYDFIFSAEPTYTAVGKTIREELINHNNDYSALAIAQAYSLDRLILYKKNIIPLIEDKKIIIQDRGISSSLAYQTSQNQDLTFDILLALPGNKLAMEYRPDHLIIIKTSAHTAAERLSTRSDKQDNSIFEKENFLKKLEDQFESSEYQNIFKQRGTQIHYLSGEEKIDIMEQQAIDLLKNILK
ncbi:MAG: deoxynucleoside kinase [Candidatus Magasanikbacteria bacterium]|nr:deoxynucleoside kinase [Candidatus Magasanikbacteria bacterium]